MQLSKLVLPAPLGPMIEVILPASTAMLTFESALSPPKASVRLSITSCAAMALPHFRRRTLPQGSTRSERDVALGKVYQPGFRERQHAEGAQAHLDQVELDV